MLRENADQLDIIRSIKAASGYAKKWASPYGVGNLDLICSLPGIGIFLMEVKTPAGKLEPKQTYEKEQWEKAGGFCVVVTVDRKENLRMESLNILCLWDVKSKTYIGIADLLRRARVKQFNFPNWDAHV